MRQKCRYGVNAVLFSCSSGHQLYYITTRLVSCTSSCASKPFWATLVVRSGGAGDAHHGQFGKGSLLGKTSRKVSPYRPLISLTSTKSTVGPHARSSHQILSAFRTVDAQLKLGHAHSRLVHDHEPRGEVNSPITGSHVSEQHGQGPTMTTHTTLHFLHLPQSCMHASQIGRVSSSNNYQHDVLGAHSAATIDGTGFGAHAAGFFTQG